jgi:manganese/zinc/iron transport system permease protein
MIQCSTLVLLALCLSLLGVVLYFKRLCMVANALSHTSLLGVIAAYLILGQSVEVLSLNTSALVCGALLSSFLTLFLQKVCQKALKAQDASSGFVFTSLFALSILLVSLYAKHTHLAQEVIMGSLEFVGVGELSLSFVLFIAIALLLLVFYQPTRIACFDKEFFALTLRRSWLFEMLFLTCTSLVITLSFRMIGLVAILGFLTAPIFIAKLTARSFKEIILISCTSALVASLLAVVISFLTLEFFDVALATSALIVLILALIFFGKLLFKFNKGILIFDKT